MLRAGVAPGHLVFTLPLFFGVAHAHHFYRLVVQEKRKILHAVMICVFQFMYTTLFGIYATFVLLRSGHLLLPSSAMHLQPHGLSGLRWLTDADSIVRKDRVLIGVSFFVGMIGFYQGLFWFTRPAFYDTESNGFWHTF